MLRSRVGGLVFGLLAAGCSEHDLTTPRRVAPAAPSAVQLTASTAQVSAGHWHACALKTDGRISCWGDNSYGQATPPTTGTFMQVGAGSYHTCALRTDGTVECWGNNGSGQLNSPSGQFTQLATGDDHACALRTDGSVACWGSYFDGEAWSPTGTFTQVSGGPMHSCGVQTDGTIACWGSSTWGQTTPPTGTFTQVDAGYMHSCGLRTDGTITCWAQFPRNWLVAPAGTFTQVSAGGYYFTCAVRTDGTIACWGTNDHGESTPPTGTFTQVSAGWDFACGLRTDGTVTCWGADDHGQATPPTSNRPPMALPGGPYAGDEGTALALNLGGSDQDGDLLEYTWNLGDGTTGTGSTPPTSHTYTDAGSYTLSLTVDDGKDLTDTKTTTVTVTNVAPTILVNGLTGPTTPIQLMSGSASASLSVSFTDPAGAADAPFTAQLACGNGGTSTPTVAIGVANAFSCAYTAPGVYAVDATVKDKHGAISAPALFQVVVYDPTVGFVTGGGWIASPAGANTPEPALSGKVTFGFVAKYLPGAQTPSGNTEFQFREGNLAFSSTQFEWLVVAGARAQFKGAGTINGEGEYGFLLTAIDGQVNGGGGIDRFRLKIWDRATGEVVYDNQMGAADDSTPTTSLGGGSIVIHG